VLEYLRKQQDFVSLRAVREALGHPDMDPRQPAANPVHQVLARLVESDAIRLVEPTWTGPHFATRDTPAVFPDPPYVPVVFRREDDSRHCCLAWATWPPGLPGLRFRMRAGASYTCRDCGCQFDTSPKRADLAADCPKCAALCPNTEVEAIAYQTCQPGEGCAGPRPST
jgi:hypothetical protein